MQSYFEDVDYDVDLVERPIEIPKSQTDRFANLRLWCWGSGINPDILEVPLVNMALAKKDGTGAMLEILKIVCTRMTFSSGDGPVTLSMSDHLLFLEIVKQL